MILGKYMHFYNLTLNVIVTLTLMTVLNESRIKKHYILAV